jgi:HD superfamily phosphohydrolase
LNDPIYGFVMIPRGLILELIDHPWFQRLRRIKQLGLSDFVYPGAVHSRFHHAMGVFHLMSRAIEILRMKGQAISEEEAEGALIAALLHDAGHGPFSHALENSLLPIEHEAITLRIMERLDAEFGGRLRPAMEIFAGNHPKRFLCQLVTGQLDVDRMDYLNRDSFYSGVVEGSIGYHRLLTMMDVDDGRLVFEEKAGLSIENYLAARRLMYWQVYMHKTCIVAEQMLELLLARAKHLGWTRGASPALAYFIELKEKDGTGKQEEQLDMFGSIDDADVEMFLKMATDAEDGLLALLANGLLSRKFFKVKVSAQVFPAHEVADLREQCIRVFACRVEEASQLVRLSQSAFTPYEPADDEILIRTKTGQVLPASEILSIGHFCKTEQRHFMTFPAGLSAL